jgi:hypothetical protein
MTGMKDQKHGGVRGREDFLRGKFGCGSCYAGCHLLISHPFPVQFHHREQNGKTTFLHAVQTVWPAYTFPELAFLLTVERQGIAAMPT